jgi:hypothetical protein
MNSMIECDAKSLTKCRSARLFFVLTFVLLCSSISWSGDKLINVQGKLTDSGGTPLTGTQTVTFRLYTSLTGSTTAAFWTETKSISLATGGLFNVTLGTAAASSLDSYQFNSPFYLGLQVAGDANELTPRQLLGASGYALGSLGNFDVADGITASTMSITGAATVGSLSTSGLIAASTMTVSSVTVTNLAATNATINNTTISSATVALATISSGTVYSWMVLGHTGTADPPIGRIGEYRETITGYISFPASGTWGDLGSIVLPPGHWNVGVHATADLNGATMTWFQIAIGEESGTNLTGLIEQENMSSSAQPPTTTGGQSLEMPSYRVKCSSDDSRYAKIYAIYSAGSPRIRGKIYAWRIH